MNKKTKSVQRNPATPEILDTKDARQPAVIAELEHYRGPLPKASDFAAYEKVHKGAANRILKMAEKSLGAEVSYGYFDRFVNFVSMLLGKGFLYFLVVVAVYLVIKDKPIAALLAGLAPIISAIYATFKKS